jgi:hypothetical protein
MTHTLTRRAAAGAREVLALGRGVGIPWDLLAVSHKHK